MDEKVEQNPFTRPWFVVSAVAVGIFIVVGVIVTIMALRSPATSRPTVGPPVGSPQPLIEPTSSTSVCGLPGVADAGTSLSTPPEVTWAYEGTIAYPRSTEFGPGRDAAGVRSCFAQSPEGAVLAASNAAVQVSGTAAAEWADYFVTGPARAALVSDTTAATEQGADTRLRLGGFRLLDYTEDSAVVDIAVTGSAGGESVTISMVYTLVWESGDWKLFVSDPAVPMNVAQIPNLADYVLWE